jgi:hypothetical protein
MGFRADGPAKIAVVDAAGGLSHPESGVSVSRPKYLQNSLQS